MKFDEESFKNVHKIRVCHHECWPEAWPPCYLVMGEDEDEMGIFMEWALEDFKKFIKSKWIEYGKHLEESK